MDSEIGTCLLTFFEVKIYDYGGGQDCDDYDDKRPPLVVQVNATIFDLIYQPGPKYF